MSDDYFLTRAERDRMQDAVDEERARIIAIIEARANDWHNRIPDEQPDWREAIDDMIAAIKEHR